LSNTLFFTYFFSIFVGVIYFESHKGTLEYRHNFF